MTRGDLGIAVFIVVAWSGYLTDKLIKAIREQTEILRQAIHSEGGNLAHGQEGERHYLAKISEKLSGGFRDE